MKKSVLYALLCLWGRHPSHIRHSRCACRMSLLKHSPGYQTPVHRHRTNQAAAGAAAAAGARGSSCGSSGRRCTCHLRGTCHLCRCWSLSTCSNCCAEERDSSGLQTQETGGSLKPVLSAVPDPALLLLSQTGHTEPCHWASPPYCTLSSYSHRGRN